MPRTLRVEPSPELNALTHAINAAAMEVHRRLGPGLIETVYESALCIELELRGIPFERQRVITVEYRGRPAAVMRIDLVVAETVIVELKCVDALLPFHRAQAISYLSATPYPVALLYNFRAHLLKYGMERFLRGELLPG